MTVFGYSLTPSPVSLFKYSDNQNSNYCTDITGLKKIPAKMFFLQAFLRKKLPETFTKYSKRKKRRMSICLAE